MIVRACRQSASYEHDQNASSCWCRHQRDLSSLCEFATMDLSTMDKAQAENQPQSVVSHGSDLSSSKHSQSAGQPTASRPTVPERAPMVQLERNLAWLQTAGALPKGRNKGTAPPEADHSRQISSVKRSGSSTSRAWSYSAVNSGFSTSRHSSPGTWLYASLC